MNEWMLFNDTWAQFRPFSVLESLEISGGWNWGANIWPCKPPAAPLKYFKYNVNICYLMQWWVSMLKTLIHDPNAKVWININLTKNWGWFQFHFTSYHITQNGSNWCILPVTRNSHLLVFHTEPLASTKMVVCKNSQYFSFKRFCPHNICPKLN